MKDDTADDLAAFGAPAEMINALPDQDTDFPVWEENAGTVGMFLKLQTQWQVSAAGVFLGLNYTAAETLFRIHSVTDQAAMMNDLQVMELAALQMLNARD